MPTRAQTSDRRRGVALLLVMVALVLGTILAVGFLASQSTTTGISENLQNQARARQIAETGLALGVQRIKSTSTWRSTYSNGVWVNNASYGGGTFTLRADDGSYSAATSAVVGDSNLNNGNTDSVTLTATATYGTVTHTSRTTIKVASGSALPGGLAVADSISLYNNASIDAYDSSQGAYGGANSGKAASILTNSTSASKVDMGNNSTITGSVQVGVGGVVSTVIHQGSGATISGTKTAQTTAATIPTVTTPSIGSSTGASSYSGTSTLSANLHCSSLSTSNNAVINISGNVVIVCDGNFTLANGASVVLGTGATLRIYVSGAVLLDNNSILNSDTTKTTSLTLYNQGSSTITMNNGSQFVGLMQSPTGGLSMKQNAHLYGAFLGANMATVANNAGFHQDSYLVNGGGSGSGGYTYTPTVMDQP